MRIVESSELSNYKVLQFDLFTENKSKILEAGEVLTPGKLIMLKNYVRIYAEDFLDGEEEQKKKDEHKKTSSQRLRNFSYESLDPEDFNTVINKESAMQTSGISLIMKWHTNLCRACIIKPTIQKSYHFVF